MKSALVALTSSLYNFSMTHILLLIVSISLPLFSSPETLAQSTIEEFLKSPLPEKFKTKEYGMSSGKYWLIQPKEFVPDPDLGFIHRPDSEIRHIERLENEIIYDATYHFDQYSRRLIPLEQEGREEFLMLFGCSFTYGNGLNDDQTLGYYLAKEGAYHVYNYAIGGSGPHMLLELLRTRSLTSQITQEKGTLVYLFHSLHPRRTVGTALNMSWLRDTPFYEEKNNEMIKVGTLETSRPFRTWFLKGIRKLNEWGFLERDFPSASRFDLQYFAKIIKASQKEFLRQFPKGKFIVYVHPLSHMDPKLRAYLKEKSIPVHEGKKLEPSEYTLSPHDGHPSAKANEALAQELLKNSLFL